MSSAAVPVTHSAAPVRSREETLRIAGVVVQVALALLVMRAFHLESRTFFGVALIAGFGFLPHALLPLSWRMPTFVLLSFACLVYVVGVLNTAWIVGAGVLLVGICHLPIKLIARVALLLLVAAALTASRMGVLPAPWGAGVWAVFGAIFMFRLALYLHAVAYEPVKPTPLQAAAYFLMLPNPVFPLFPVVDYNTFIRTHYSTPAVDTYQTGVAWIARGVMHLLLYRIVYQNLPGDPFMLTTLSGFLWYLLGTFLLYLRVSGQFHVIVGMLHLYGFALPETHKLFLLSSSFTDFWRRINIYWKDFMMKLVYYPSFFRFRRFGNDIAVVASTIVVFFVTWLLHSYQWFWILGTFPLTIPDLLFWGILGLLVIVASLRETKRGRDRSLGANNWSFRLALRVLITFTTITILWSLWSAESVIEWLYTWRAAANVDALGIVILVVLLAVGIAIAGRNWTAPKLRAATPPWWKRLEFRTVVTLVGLLALSQPAVTDRLGSAGPYIASAKLTTVNAADAALEQRGYYERLDHAPRLGAQGWETRATRPADWVGLPYGTALRRRDDFRIYELMPNVNVTLLRQPTTTNSFAMRDVPRTLAKPDSTVRIAVFGPSYVFGSGVKDHETYPAQFEQQLNGAVSQETGLKYEALNFGAPMHSLLQELAAFDYDALRFNPDVVVVSNYLSAPMTTSSHLTEVVEAGMAIPYPELDSIVRGRFPTANLPYSETLGLMRVVTDDANTWAIREIARKSRERGIIPVFMTLDLVGTQSDTNTAVVKAARDAGFIMLDMSDPYGNKAAHESLRLAAWDSHPNAAGYKLVAQRLVQEFRKHPELLTASSSASLSTKTTP
ncbi:MAG: SGNH/GDSL hydrolase family protein [Gemmatimonas sp.]